MKKRTFPKNLKFGTYLPKRRGMSYIKADDFASSLERFMGEYFSHNTVMLPPSELNSHDAVRIDGEFTAYLFRNVMSLLSGANNLKISITTSENRFTVSFSQECAFKLNDAELVARLIESAELSGFEMSVIGNTISFSALLERGKLVISALTRAAFAEILERVFFD